MIVPKFRKQRPVRDIATAVSIATLLLVSGRLPARADDDNPDFWDRMGSSVGNTFKHAGQSIGLGKPPPPPQAESPSGCPTIEVLDGTGAQRVTAETASGNAGVKYQYSILNVARECQLSGNAMTLRVGVQGKVLLGPQGSAGAFDVPIRIVVVTEADQKPVVSKLYKAPSSIPSGQSAAPFTLVADGIGVSLGGRKAVDYSIKVGIDTGGKADTGAKSAHHHKGKRSTATASQ
jgi:hypothetical protein